MNRIQPLIGQTMFLISTITLNPATVDLLLSGPLPVLNEIKANPELVRISLDATDMSHNQSINVTPTIIAPAGVQTQLVPGSILVIIE